MPPKKKRAATDKCEATDTSQGGSSNPVHHCLVGSWKKSKTASTILLVPKKHAGRLFAALADSSNQHHDWTLKDKEDVDIDDVPSSLRCHMEIVIDSSIPDVLPASEGRILELVIDGAVSKVQYIVYEIQNTKHSLCKPTSWAALETSETDKDKKDKMVEILSKMDDDNGDSYFVRSIKVMDRAEFLIMWEAGGLCCTKLAALTDEVLEMARNESQHEFLVKVGGM